MKEREHIKWRRGRSIPFRWSIKIGGQVPQLAEGEIKLFMRNSIGAKVAWPYEIEDGNVLVFDWVGKDQKRGGVYSFTALYHDGLDDQNVLDSCVDIELVESTCDENDCCGCGDFAIEPVYMDGDFLIIGGGSSEGAVRYNMQQDLTNAQQSTARANINAKRGGYTRIEKIHTYVHEIWYDGVDYGYADLLPHTPLGACTSIRKGKFFARNLDWQYSELCEFFVHTPAANGRHAVDGFGGNIPALTKEVVESGAWNAAYNWLPLSIADGHNDAGLCCSMNVVPTKTSPNTYERTTGTNPTKPTLNGLMIVRYILDNHTDALAAAQDIADNWNVVMPHTETFDEELHFLIADKTQTIVLEFVGNEAKIIQKPDQEGYITNFRLNGVDWTSTLTMISTIEPFGQGVERYGLISSAIVTPPNITAALGFVAQLNYTNAYTIEGDNAWLTEFTGLHDELTVQARFATPSVYDATLAAAHQAYLDRTRDGQTWQTTHSVVYDIESGECIFITQQDESTLTQRDMASSGGGLTPSQVRDIVHEETDDAFDGKQDKLISGDNIKTVNGTSVLGSGDIVIPKGDKGDPGEQGPVGPAGPAGPQGPAGQDGAITEDAPSDGNQYARQDGEWVEVQGGGGEPAAYIKDAAVSQDGNTLTLTKKDGAQVAFAPSGGGGGGVQGVISQTQTWAADYSGYTMSNIVRGSIPQSFIDMWNRLTNRNFPASYYTPQCSFNYQTGYFEVDDLTDISYNEALDIYMLQDPTVVQVNTAYIDITRKYRCLLGLNAGYNWSGGINLGLNNGGNNFERICISGYVTLRNTPWKQNASEQLTNFHNLSSVKYMSLANRTGSLDMSYCESLRTALFSDLKIPLNLKHSKWLSKESLIYIIKYSAASTAAPITLHADVYNKAAVEGGEWYEDVQAELASKPNISLVSA